jgi:Flp pilus assembly pilin Flp
MFRSPSKQVLQCLSGSRLWRQQSGQDVAEYALLIVGIALVVVGVLYDISGATNHAFNSAGSSVITGGSGSSGGGGSAGGGTGSGSGSGGSGSGIGTGGSSGSGGSSGGSGGSGGSSGSGGSGGSGGNGGSGGGVGTPPMPVGGHHPRPPDFFESAPIPAV